MRPVRPQRKACRPGLRKHRAAGSGHPRQHAAGGREVLGAEEHPGGDYGGEGQQSPREPFRRAPRPGGIPAQTAPGMVDHEVEPVEAAPGDEVPARAVPQPAEEHRHREVQLPSEGTATVAAQRNVKIVAQKAREAHVPSSPELDDVAGLVGGVEVEGQDDAEELGEAGGHVRVAGEIEVDLQGVGQRPGPRREECARGRGGRVEDRGGGGGGAGGEDDLLEETEREHRQAHGEILGLRSIGLVAGELGHHLLVVKDGPGDEVRKVGHEQGVVDRAVLPGEPASDVHEEGDLGEGEEGDSQRQNQARPRLRGPGQKDLAQEEAAYL